MMSSCPFLKDKNPQLFPDIFDEVYRNYNAPIEFWVMGTGKYSEYVRTQCAIKNIPLKMWGNIDPEQMPVMLNCVDVLILPSRNEGLPLIAAEALACGANAVGARVGGIPEVMGVENTFEHGTSFIPRISNRIVEMLNSNITQELLPCYSWKETAKIENDIYKAKLKM